MTAVSGAGIGTGPGSVGADRFVHPEAHHCRVESMPNPEARIVVKKYANQRLYNASVGVYVALEDLAGMVRRGEDFIVYDAGSGEDITRSLLMLITPTTEH
jgi:hypothetical protein